MTGPINPRDPQGLPEIPVGPDHLRRFLVDIARDVWRAGRAAERASERGQPVPDDIAAAIERLHQDLQAFGLTMHDPVGQVYEPGMRVEIAQAEPGGAGELRILRTVLPGVGLGGRLLEPPSVVVGRSEPP